MTTTLRRGLGLVALGMLLTVADLTVNAVDLLPDLLGWLLVGVGTARAADAVDDARYRGRMFAAGLLAVVAMTLGGVDLVDALHPPLGLVYLVVGMAQPAVVAFALVRYADVAGTDPLRRRWTRVGALLGAAGLVVVTLVTSVGSVEETVGVAAVVFWVGAVAYYLVALLRTRSAPAP